MRKPSVVVGFVLALMLCLSTAPAYAQKFDVFGGYSFSTNNSNFGSNYASLSSSTFNPLGYGLHGYNVAAVYNFDPHIGIEANFAGHNGNTTLYSDITGTINTDTVKSQMDSYYTVFGPKLTQPVGNFQLFGHVLVGVNWNHVSSVESGTDCDSSTGTCNPIKDTSRGFAFVGGGGVDWTHGMWGIRILEVDFVHNSGNVSETYPDYPGETWTSPVTRNNISLSTGIVFHFGKTQ